MRRARWLAVGTGILVLAAIILGCGGPTREGAQPQATPPARPTNTPIVEVPGIEVPAGAEELVQRVREELAARLNQAGAAIDIVDVERAEWPTAAMGCPQPDTGYAQVVTSGYRVRLKTDGTTYEVHVSDDGNVIFCDGQLETPRVIVPEGAEQLIARARSALAERLNQVGESIDLVDVEPAEWPTAAMGCPEPDTAYAQVKTSGYVIRLKTDGNAYEVHVSDDGRVVFCDTQKESRAMEVPTAAEPAVRAARQDLASRVGVAAENVQVEQVESVEWRNNSLGCPEPGKMYLQVITPGYRVVLKAGDQTYEYHTDRGNRAVYCGEATTRVAPSRLSVAQIRDLVERARSELAQRQGVDPTTVSVVGATPVPALDQPAPCPQADQLAGDGPEYQIELQIEGTSYVYRGQGEAVVLCSP